MAEDKSDKKKKDGASKDDDDDDDSSGGCEIISTDLKVRRHDVYLGGAIGPVSKYTKLLSKLDTCDDSKDRFIIHINSPGGYLATTMQLRNSMEQCAAHVTTVAEHQVASAAVILLLAGRDIVVKPGAYTFLHYYSSGMMGKGHELEAESDFYKVYWKETYRKLLKGFLTPKEIRQVVEGRDFYFDTQETLRRLSSTGRKLIKHPWTNIQGGL